jgi:hypothetical protein
VKAGEHRRVLVFVFSQPSEANKEKETPTIITDYEMQREW